MRTRTEIGRAYSFYRDKITGLAPAHIYTEYLSEGTSIRERQREAFGKKQEDIVILTAGYAQGDHLSRLQTPSRPIASQLV